MTFNAFFKGKLARKWTSVGRSIFYDSKTRCLGTDILLALDFHGMLWKMKGLREWGGTRARTQDRRHVRCVVPASTSLIPK